jgi:hypothetical protein
VLNSAGQTGSVLGVAPFGSASAQTKDFVFAAHATLAISVLLLLSVAATIAMGLGMQQIAIRWRPYSPGQPGPAASLGRGRIG